MLLQTQECKARYSKTTSPQAHAFNKIVSKDTTQLNQSDLKLTCDWKLWAQGLSNSRSSRGDKLASKRYNQQGNASYDAKVQESLEAQAGDAMSAGMRLKLQ